MFANERKRQKAPSRAVSKYKDGIHHHHAHQDCAHRVPSTPLTVLAYLQWVERKVIAHVQVRMGPSRVGPHGLLQPLADVIKLITKEGVMPPHVRQFLLPSCPFSRSLHGLDFHLGDSLRNPDHDRALHHRDAVDGRQCRPAGDSRRKFHGRIRHSSSRLVVRQQQVRASRRIAQLRPDDQL